MIQYQGEKGGEVIKSVRKTVKRLLSSNIKLQVSFTCNKLSSRFKIKGKTNFEHKHDVTYPGTCPGTKCNDNCIGKGNDKFLRGLKTTTADTLNHTN